MERPPFSVLDSSMSQATPKRQRLRACARVEFSLNQQQLAAMLSALGTQSTASMQAMLDSHGGKNPCIVLIDIGMRPLATSL